jgi:predicted short-subunit dehydrogenase-like oxidoreductase (DUF2520 family)
MFRSVHVVGRGRAGTAIAGRLREHGLEVRVGREPAATAELVILAVPDAAIAEVAAHVEPGPWIAHVSGATPLSVLDPHAPARRFSVHPLQTLSLERGPEQLDGAWAALGAETPEARDAARWLAATLGLRPFEIAEADRVLYHAGAVIAGNFLVTLYRAASRLMAETGAPPEALVPLMQRTIENGFALTGPIARGDWTTVEAHLRALEERAPDLAPLYRALADATPR